MTLEEKSGNIKLGRDKVLDRTSIRNKLENKLFEALEILSYEKIHIPDKTSLIQKFGITRTSKIQNGLAGLIF